ncbi:MAG: MBL fold metallo-hydrolase [Candidatus Thorarchaeota archaeon]
MSEDYKIPIWAVERLIEIFNLTSEQKNQIFYEFEKFKPPTSVRKFIKRIAKKTEFSEELLQNFFWISSDLYAFFLENDTPFHDYFQNNIKFPIENDYSDLKNKIYSFTDFEKFLSSMINLIDFEYYEVSSINGINQINIGFSNIIRLYHFTIKDKNVLIDAGYSWKYWQNAFYKALKELGTKIEEIDYCIITHEHPDHIGLVKTLMEANPDVKIGMHETAYELAKLREEMNTANNIEDSVKERAELLISYGVPKGEVDLMMQRFARGGMGFEFVEPNLLLKNNDRIIDGELLIVHSPGHSVGHICIYYPKKGILFSGDHILSNITPHLGTLVIPAAEEFNKRNNFENILEHYLNSLDRIDELNSRIILPGHEQIIYDPHKRITEIKNHHQDRLYDISRIIENNPLPPLQIALQHFGEDLDQMNRILAISETLVHLDYLEFQHKVHKTKKKGILLYWSEDRWEKIQY